MERLDHILIRVDNLENSVDDFRKAGFRVYFGASPEKAYNAMIYFQDNSFIELVDTSKFPLVLTFLAKIKITNLLGASYKRVGKYALSKNTFLDYAVYSQDIEGDYNRIKKEASKLYHLKRRDVLGRWVKWKLFALKDINLPFVMSDYFPCKYPENNACNHDNATLGIYKVSIRTTMDLFKLKTEILKLFTIKKDHIFLINDVLQITTANSIIEYRKGAKNEISEIKLNDLEIRQRGTLLKYGISN